MTPSLPLKSLLFISAFITCFLLSPFIMGYLYVVKYLRTKRFFVVVMFYTIATLQHSQNFKKISLKCIVSKSEYFTGNLKGSNFIFWKKAIIYFIFQCCIYGYGFKFLSISCQPFKNHHYFLSLKCYLVLFQD